jgi:hypothetical protein
MLKVPTKKNHYNPESYLLRFANAENKLFCFDKKQNKIIPQIYSEWGYENHLYTQATEDRLAKIDGKFTNVVSKIQNRIVEKQMDITLNKQDIIDITSFMSVQFIRTPEAKAFIVSNVNRLNMENPLYKTEMKEWLLRQFDPIETYERSIFETIPEIATELLSVRWTFIHAGGQKSFISADSVYGFATTKLEHGSNRKGLGIASPDTFKSFSLSKNICLVLDSMKIDPESRDKINILTFDDKKVMALNGNIFWNAKRFAYGESKNILKVSMKESKKAQEKTLLELNKLSINNHDTNNRKNL